MTVPEIWRGQNRGGKKKKKNERSQNHIASPTGIAKNCTSHLIEFIHKVVGHPCQLLFGEEELRVIFIQVTLKLYAQF